MEVIPLEGSVRAEHEPAVAADAVSGVERRGGCLTGRGDLLPVLTLAVEPPELFAVLASSGDTAKDVVRSRKGRRDVAVSWAGSLGVQPSPGALLEVEGEVLSLIHI